MISRTNKLHTGGTHVGYDGRLLVILHDKQLSFEKGKYVGCARHLENMVEAYVFKRIEYQLCVVNMGKLTVHTAWQKRNAITVPV